MALNGSMIVNGFERMWKEAVVAYFNLLLSQHVSGGTNESKERSQSGYPISVPSTKGGNDLTRRSLGIDTYREWPLFFLSHHSHNHHTIRNVMC
jgi:hypothetical protein